MHIFSLFFPCTSVLLSFLDSYVCSFIKFSIWIFFYFSTLDLEMHIYYVNSCKHNECLRFWLCPVLMSPSPFLCPSPCSLCLCWRLGCFSFFVIAFIHFILHCGLLFTIPRKDFHLTYKFQLLSFWHLTLLHEMFSIFLSPRLLNLLNNYFNVIFL